MVRTLSILVLQAALVGVASCAQVLDLEDGVRRSEGGGGIGASGSPTSTGGTGGAGGDHTAYADAVLNDNPVAFWRLNETAPPDAVDSSTNQVSGLYKGGVNDNWGDVIVVNGCM